MPRSYTRPKAAKTPTTKTHQFPASSAKPLTPYDILHLAASERGGGATIQTAHSDPLGASVREEEGAVSAHETIACPACGQRLRVPADRGRLSVRCPKCGEEFSHPAVARTSRAGRKGGLRARAWIIGTVVLAGLVGLVYLGGRSPEGAGALGRAGGTPSPRNDRWVTISYADLLDPDAIVRTGQPLSSALRDPHLKGAVQPFVDRYSHLLQCAVEMLQGPDELPHRSVVEHFPPGSPQPAWVALFRGGRIHAVADGRDHVRLFLPGQTPEAAYKEHYSVIRHCLNGLVPPNGHPLRVEVIAYENNYPASVLKLNTRCHQVSDTSFPPEKMQPDLAALSEFFSQKPILQGAQLSRSEGLVLYGTQEDETPSLAGHDLSLADLAVAYRAAFHAGDNDAFISLDPHRDATKATVNSGGFLEDTHIGSVVLEADKRFKTITSGFDPDSRRDLREYTTRYLPSFMTSSERDLVSQEFSDTGRWIGTRFWFYPDETGVDTDLNYEFAVVTKPQFTADAERSREDFQSPADFERKKKALLSPSIRQNIHHLNANYAQYASAFAELAELRTVARLMGIASWLKQADPERLDLDALLAVELPAHTTERERTKLLAATILSCSPTDRARPEYVRANAELLYLSPVLDSAPKDYFPTTTDLAKYLGIVEHMDREEALDELTRTVREASRSRGPRGPEKVFRMTRPPRDLQALTLEPIEPIDLAAKEPIDVGGTHARHRDEASRLLAPGGPEKVRDMIRRRRDLQALVKYATRSADAPLPPTLRALDASITRDERTLDRLEMEINALKKQMEGASLSGYNDLVDKHNRLVRQLKAAHTRHNDNVERHNQMKIKTLSVMEIGGGINLEPRRFRINRTRSSPRLTAFKGLARSVGNRTRLRVQGADWIRSRGGTTKAQLEVASLPRVNWDLRSAPGPANASLTRASALTGEKAWRLTESETGSWRSLLREGPSQYREASYQADQGVFRIAEFQSGEVKNHLVGQMTGNRIVFRRPDAANLVAPQEPPIWWNVGDAR